MSAASAAAPARDARPTTLDAYRDDGPIAATIGRVARAMPVPGAALAFLAAALVIGGIVLGGEDLAPGAVAAVLAAAIVAGGLAGGRPETGRFRWTVPPLLRLTEYAGVLWIVALAGDDAHPGAYALLAAVAFRHYDIVYRLRHRGVAPPAWVGLLGTGWDGRLILGFVFWRLDLLPEAFYVLGAVLAVVFVAESVAGWTSSTRGQRASVYEEEEDEGQ